MLSRVADCLYWMSRYVERAENVARFIDVNQHLTLDLGEALPEQWSPVVYTTGDQEDFQARYPGFERRGVLEFLTFDEQNPNSIVSCLRAARENARQVRETISAQMWEELNKFYLLVRAAAVDQDVLESPYDLLHEIKSRSQLLVGMTDTTLSHGEAWHFVRLGRLLERADKTSRILDVKYFLLLPSPGDVGSSLDIVGWSALLKSASALEMYRQRHGRLDPAHVVDFLLLDRHFARSVRFCLVKSEESLHAISGAPFGMFSNRAEQAAGKLRADLDYTDLVGIFAEGMHEFIDRLQLDLNRLGLAIHETFFSPPVSRGESPAKQAVFRASRPPGRVAATAPGEGNPQ